MHNNPDSFELPDWSAPFDADEYLRSIPEHATSKGMFFEPLRARVKEAGGVFSGRQHYVAFKDYPAREYLRVVLDSAAQIFPGAAVRQSLRQIGWLAFPTFSQSLLGRVLFKFAGSDVAKALRAVPRAYGALSSVSSAEVIELGEGSAIVRLRQVWDVPDASEVGVFEGGLRTLGREGEVRVRRLDLADCDLRLDWS